MIVYLDTSVVLRVLFREEGPLETWGTWDEAYSSELLGVEARRVIDRMRLELCLWTTRESRLPRRSSPVSKERDRVHSAHADDSASCIASDGDGRPNARRHSPWRVPCSRVSAEVSLPSSRRMIDSRPQRPERSVSSPSEREGGRSPHHSVYPPSITSAAPVM